MVEDAPLNFAISTKCAKPGVDHISAQSDSAADLAALNERAEAAEMALIHEGETRRFYTRSGKHCATHSQEIAREDFHALGSTPALDEVVLNLGFSSAAAGRLPSFLQGRVSQQRKDASQLVYRSILHPNVIEVSP